MALFERSDWLLKLSRKSIFFLPLMGLCDGPSSLFCGDIAIPVEVYVV